jgi:hypothetical protein
MVSVLQNLAPDSLETLADLRQGDRVAKKKRGGGRPRLSAKRRGEAPFIGVRFSDELLARVDRYRKAQEVEPVRSAAIRALVEAGLVAAGF